MKYFSMFSGVGGFELGIQRAIPNAECVGYSEIDKYSVQVYNKQFGGHKDYGDATKIIPEELPDFDLLCGGVPCQAWSIAGKRDGFNDIRGTMWFKSFRVLKAKKPKYFLFENVKGLLSHDKGNSFERLCELMCECGYVIDFTILNSKFFGVPQNRERVFILGIREDLIDKSNNKIENLEMIRKDEHARKYSTGNNQYTKKKEEQH